MLDQAAARLNSVRGQGNGGEEESLGQRTVAEMRRHALLQQVIDFRRQLAEVEFFVIIECVHFLLVVAFRVGKPVPATSMQA